MQRSSLVYGKFDVKLIIKASVSFYYEAADAYHTAHRHSRWCLNHFTKKWYRHLDEFVSRLASRGDLK